MKQSPGNIVISRKGGKLHTISVAMPIWDNIGEDGFLSIDIPLFNLKSFAKDESNADESIREAIVAFCIGAEKHGKGLETELKVLGWSFTDQTENMTVMSFELSERNFMLNRVMQTGESFADKLDIAS